MGVRRRSLVAVVAAAVAAFTLVAACGDSSDDAQVSSQSLDDRAVEKQETEQAAGGVAVDAAGGGVALDAFDESAPADADAAVAPEGAATSDTQTRLPESPLPTSPVRPSGRVAAIIRTGTIDLAVEVFDVAVAKVNALATQNGGYVEGSQESRQGDYPTASITIRVPSDKFDDLRSGLVKVGDVQSAEISAQDVTGQLVDLEARLKNLRSEEAALNALLARTTTVEEILAVQPQLFDVREQIEQLDGQRAYLEQQAAMSTLTVIVHPSDVVIDEPDEPTWWDRVTDRVGSAWSDLSENVVYFLVVALPILAIAAALVWLVARLARRFSSRTTPASSVSPVTVTGSAAAPGAAGGAAGDAAESAGSR